MLHLQMSWITESGQPTALSLQASSIRNECHESALATLAPRRATSSTCSQALSAEYVYGCPFSSENKGNTMSPGRMLRKAVSG